MLSRCPSRTKPASPEISESPQSSALARPAPVDERPGRWLRTPQRRGAFVRSAASVSRPDIQFHFLPVASAQVNYDEGMFMPKGHAFVMIPTVLYPESRGEKSGSQSADPAQAPIIDPEVLLGGGGPPRARPWRPASRSAMMRSEAPRRLLRQGALTARRRGGRSDAARRGPASLQYALFHPARTARWETGRRLWSMRPSAYAGSRGFASSTRPSCRRSWEAIRTLRRS